MSTPTPKPKAILVTIFNWLVTLMFDKGCLFVVFAHARIMESMLIIWL